MNKRFIAAALCGLMCITPIGAFAETTKEQAAQAETKKESGVQRYEVLILGDRDQSGEDYVSQLQRWLKHYGHFDEEPTGYYGEKTQKAVMAFQEKHGTTVDGKAGPVTRKILLGDAYKDIPSSRKVTNALGASIGEYAAGDRGEEITKIQTRLKELGYYEYSRITDYYGPITEEAVLEFKKENDLNTDSSKIDAKTYNAMFSDSAKKKTVEKKTEEKKTEATTAKKSSSQKSATTEKKTTAKKTTTKSTTTAKKTNSTSASTATSSKAEKFVQIALNQQGKRYVYGSTGPNTFDCSGLVYYSLRQVGITPPRTSASQSQHSAWQKVNKSQLKRGDLVFFASSASGSRIGHVGIYLGGGQFVHASSGKKMSVIISNLNSGSYAKRFRWGRRVF